MQRHRPPTGRTLLAVPLLVATIVLSSSVSNVRSADAQPPGETRLNRPTTTIGPVDPVPTVEDLRLACAPELVAGRRGILCRWGAATNPATRSYRLYRSVDGSARQLIASVGGNGRLAFFDTDLTVPTVVVYGVVSLDGAGRTIGVSAPQRVELG